MKFFYVLLLLFAELFISIPLMSASISESDTTKSETNSSPEKTTLDNQSTIHLFDVKTAWDIYNPPTFDDITFRVKVPGEETLRPLIESDIDLFTQQKIGNEVKKLRDKVDQDSSDVNTINKLGIILASNGLYNKGKTWFRRALSVDSTYCPVHNNLANIEYENNHFDSAKKLYLSALHYCPNSPITMYNLSLAELQLGNLNEAEKLYQQAIAADPSIEGNLFSAGAAKQAEASTKKASEGQIPQPLWAE